MEDPSGHLQDLGPHRVRVGGMQPVPCSLCRRGGQELSGAGQTPLRPAAHLLMLPWQWANAVNQASTFYLGPGTDQLAGDAEGRGVDRCLTYRPSVLRPAGLERFEQPKRGRAAWETPMMRADSPSHANLAGSAVGQAPS